ncbi:MAG: hypothetical protein M1816_000655 [Peltula sp. TS41687]|nr:MAG: hypothetical protein M1816_000655 [Peltula sp. TS41687]
MKATDQTTTTPTPTNPARTRLHITPLNASLLQTVLPPSLLPLASNISYHSLQTFPEADYGYIELPSAEAKRLQSKLHGSILRGRKVRVEQALAARWPGAEEEEEGEKEVVEQRRLHPPSGKRPTRDKECAVVKRCDKARVLSGVLLEHRKVQRGWVRSPRFSTAAPASKVMGGGEAKGAKSSDKSKSKSQCLFRTRLPPNAAPLEEDKESGKAKSGGQKKRGRSEEEEEEEQLRETVVREFSTTTKYSTFLKGNNQVPAKKPVSEFVDGKGWVDEDGNVVEAVTASGGRDGRLREHVNPGVESLGADPVNENDGPSDNDAGDGSESSGSAGTETESNTSSSETEEEEEEEEEEEASSASEEEVSMSRQAAPKRPKLTRAHEAPQVAAAVHQQTTQEPFQPGSPRVTKGPTTSLTITIPPNPNQPLPLQSSDGKEVHPLEAIFKKPALRGSVSSSVPNITVDTEPPRPFSFFDDGPGTTTAYGSQIPQTPFTQQDFQLRGIRSAAPTPDTAALGKRFSFWGEDDEEEDEEEEQEQGGGVEGQKNSIPEPHESASAMVGDDGGNTAGQSGEKGFEELFWERRGETNRAWKRRRRETGKFKRKMENKRLANQNV